MNGVRGRWRSATLSERLKSIGRMIAARTSARAMSPIPFCVFSWLYVIVRDPGSRRAGDDLDSTRLAAYLRERLPARGIRIDDIDWASSLHVEPLPGGRSNLTDLLR